MPAPSAQALLQRVAPLLDARCGVLKPLVPMPAPPSHGPRSLHAYAAAAARVADLRTEGTSVSQELGELSGYGTATDDTTARVRAVCEGIERYCAVMYPTRVRTATARALGGRALDLRRLPRCSQRERLRAKPAHRLRIPDPDAVEQWVEGRSLTRGEPTLVPRSVVYLGLPQPLSEQYLFPESTGFAAGGDFESAALSALCEVIERDSVALWWLHQIPAPRLAASSATPALSRLLADDERIGIASHFFDLTSDLGVPVVGLVQVHAREHPHAVVAAACRMATPAAMLRVAEEAGSLRHALREPGSAALGRTGAAAGARFEPGSPRDFGLLYAGADGPARFRFVIDGASPAPPPPPVAGGLRGLVDRLALHGAEVIAVDVTQPEIAEFGLTVVRVIVPELMRISFCHDVRYLGHPRLYAAPARMGHGARDEAGVTDDPYPFA